jgi:hypothetical protein
MSAGNLCLPASQSRPPSPAPRREATHALASNTNDDGYALGFEAATGVRANLLQERDVRKADWRVCWSHALKRLCRRALTGRLLVVVDLTERLGEERAVAEGAFTRRAAVSAVYGLFGDHRIGSAPCDPSGCSRDRRSTRPIGRSSRWLKVVSDTGAFNAGLRCVSFLLRVLSTLSFLLPGGLSV